MKKLSSIVLAVFLVCTSVGSGFLSQPEPVYAAGEVPVSISPSATEVDIGDNFTVNVNIGEVDRLNAVEYVINFDSTVLQLDNVTAGMLDSTAFPIYGTTVLGPGQVKVLQSFDLSTINGSGYLSVLHFQTLKIGTSSVNITDGILSGLDGEIQATWTNGTVNVLNKVISIAVTPTTETVFRTQTAQYAANATWADNTTTDCTASAVWTSTNTSVATIQSTGATSPGLATAEAAGTANITAEYDGIVSPAVTLTVEAITTVEVNGGIPISLSTGANVTGSADGSTGIPITIEGIADIGMPDHGFAAFEIAITWDPSVIDVHSPMTTATQYDNSGWEIAKGNPDTSPGWVNILGWDSDNYTVDGDFMVVVLGFEVIGDQGDSTTVNVTVTDLGTDVGATIPYLTINTTVTVSNYVAETSLSEAKDASNIAVVQVNIDRIKYAANGTTATVPGGIGSFLAQIDTTPGIQVLAVNEVSPYTGVSYNATNSTFYVNSVGSPEQAANSTVAEIVMRLTGNATTTCNLTITFLSITAADSPGINIPEESANVMTFQRGDTTGDGTFSVYDVLYYAQYQVGTKALGEIRLLNGASVNPGNDVGVVGDKPDVYDVLYNAQYQVGTKNSYFE